jgi:hypothetical protein
MKEPGADYSGFNFFSLSYPDSYRDLSTRLPDGQEGKGLFQHLKRLFYFFED